MKSSGRLYKVARLYVNAVGSQLAENIEVFVIPRSGCRMTMVFRYYPGFSSAQI